MNFIKNTLHFLFMIIGTVFYVLLGFIQIPYLLVVPFRGWLRNYVYNYVIENKLDLPRLYERYKGKESSLQYYLEPTNHPETNGGYIIKRPTNKYVFWIIIWFWLLIDDDSYCDTFSAGHNNTYLTGERKFLGFIPLNNSLGRSLLVGPVCENESIRGNSFDIGDKRTLNPKTNLLGQLIWNGRNPSYNFNYFFVESNSDKNKYHFEISDMKFGWYYSNGSWMWLFIKNW